VSDSSKGPREREGLQFDTAEPAGPAPAGAGSSSVTCASCRNTISGSYYEVNAAILCEACRAVLSEQLAGGSELGRGAKAVAFGLGAAAAGSALYYAILELTGYEIGLVALVVGFLVGKAVNRGSEGRGGPAYQALAVVLTYFAIVTTYIPFSMRSVSSTSDALGLLALAAVAPILAGFRDIIRLVIIAFALFEAWRLNTRRRLAISGPYRVGASRG
jgi:hypothetical protein